MAENDCDTLYELLFGTSPAVEDFRPSLVANCVFNKKNSLGMSLKWKRTLTEFKSYLKEQFILTFLEII